MKFNTFWRIYENARLTSDKTLFWEDDKRYFEVSRKKKVLESILNRLWSVINNNKSEG